MALLRRRRVEHVAPAVDNGLTLIVDVAGRHTVRVGGEVVRMRARPAAGIPSLAVTIEDSSGRAVAVWTGRRAIGGVTLGRRLVVEGVPIRRGDHLEFTNPAYTLLPRA
jgi:hypothetical protein